VIEVTSPSTRRTDLGRKVDFYARVGVEEYFIIDTAPWRRGTGPLSLIGRRLREGSYSRIEPDEKGRLRSRTAGLLLSLRPEAPEVVLANAETGQEVLSESAQRALAEAAARQAAEQPTRQAEQRAQVEATGRQEAEQRAQVETTGRQEAEQRAQVEATGRQEAEQRAQAEATGRQEAEQRAQAEADSRRKAEERLRELEHKLKRLGIPSD
ncbi:MAG: Uma2 family endonuclease, partial [Acidobacteriota bacterium]